MILSNASSVEAPGANAEMDLHAAFGEPLLHEAQKNVRIDARLGRLESVGKHRIDQLGRCRRTQRQALVAAECDELRGRYQAPPPGDPVEVTHIRDDRLRVILREGGLFGSNTIARSRDCAGSDSRGAGGTD